MTGEISEFYSDKPIFTRALIYAAGLSPASLPRMEKRFGNDEALNLVGSFDDLQHLCIPHEALNFEFPQIPCSAEELDGISRDCHRGIAREAFCDGRICGTLRSSGKFFRRVSCEKHAGAELHQHIAQQKLKALEVCEWCAELFPVLQMFRSALDGTARERASTSGNIHPSACDHRAASIVKIAQCGRNRE